MKHMKKTSLTPTRYEAPALRLVAVDLEALFALSMTNGFIYDAEEEGEYWEF